MAYNVFIDGEAGTTGLQVRDRLMAHPDVSLITIDSARRKNKAARQDAMAAADAVILCLPDDAAIEAALLAVGLGVKIIDASTAHRTHPDWVYGFPELDSRQRQKIAETTRVANVGCYAAAMIALIKPLIDAGLITPQAQLNISAISGYTGGGKAMIEYMENNGGAKHFAYGLSLGHKHIPEVMAHAGLSQAPSFLPMVGDFDCGMMVQLPLNSTVLKSGVTRADLHAVYSHHYADEPFVKIRAPYHADSNTADGLTDKGYLAVDGLKGSNLLEINTLGHDASDGNDTGQAMMVARLDNLGKGASGAAVQNLNLMFGIDETTGLI